jgi:hypothetical protein
MEKIDPDEMDLYSLLVRTVRLFKKHFTLFSFLVVAGLVFAIAYYRLTSKTYRGDMIVRSGILTAPYVKKVAEHFGTLIDRASYDTLATKLELTRDEAAQIREVSAEQFKQIKDTVFTITIDAKDERIIPRLQDHFLIFLRNNEFFKTRYRQRQELYRSMIVRLGHEIRSLDSLKELPFQSKVLRANASGIVFPDQGTVYSKTVDFYRTQIRYKQALEEPESVQLVARFSPYEKSGGSILYVVLLLGALGGLLVAFSYLGIRWVIQVAKT